MRSLSYCCSYAARANGRLRFTPDPAHEEPKVRDLTGALVEIWSRLKMKLAA